LRTDFQRQLASPESFQDDGFECWGTIWLRTCYDESTDEAHQRLLDELNYDLALEVYENILDDAEHYNYTDDWRRIFEVVPERLLEETQDNADMRQKPEQHEAQIQEAKRKVNINDVDDIDALRKATTQFHLRAACRYLLIADKVALDSGKVLAVFFDDYGRTVRQSRVPPEFCEELAGAWFDGLLGEVDAFIDAEVGPDYLPGGPCGPPYAT
jgi:hypothetical protein